MLDFMRSGTHNRDMSYPDDSNLPELPGCPVLLASGIAEVDARDRAAADQMLLDHLADSSRTCCDEHGFALDPETGCTPQEINAPLPRITVKPVRFASTMQGDLFDGKEVA